MRIHPSLTKSLHEIFGSPNKTGEIGVELEVEGINLPTEVLGWEAKAEHSLRGKNGRQVNEEREDTPREYVLPRPILLKSLRGRLDNLYAALTKKGTAVQLSHRGSTHIHLNMGPRTLHDLFGFVMVFVAVEPVLLRLCGAERNGNLFCVPCYETGDFPGILSVIVQAIKKDHPRNFGQRGKYASLNIDTLGQFGSVEVRCFPNSVTPAVIEKWASWLVNIRDIAVAADETLERLLDRMIQEPAWLLQSVFEQEALNGPCLPQTPAELVSYGVEHAYECWKAIQPLFNHQKDKEVEKDKKPWNIEVEPRWDGWVDDFIPEVEHVVRPIPVPEPRGVAGFAPVRAGRRR